MTEPKVPLRVLVVDDSPSVRAVLRRFFSWTDDIVVVGEAEDGATAVQQVLDLSPDVVLMDLVMPGMDGYAATERIMEVRPTPIIVLSSRANWNQIRTAFEAMRRGAVEVLGKPENTGKWRQLADTLPDMVRTAAAARTRPVQPRPAPPRRRRAPEADVASRALRWVGIGASTGGPAALRDLLEAMPATFPMSILVVQHIAGGFEAGLADWLNRELPFSVRLAEDGEEPPPGVVRLAPGGSHLLLDGDGRLRLDRAQPAGGGHFPSADALFSSLAAVAPKASAGILLTGMGSDGVAGLGELRAAGGLTLVQDEVSCVVYGMPRVAIERGAAEIELAPRQIARYLTGAAGATRSAGATGAAGPAGADGAGGARGAAGRRGSEP